MTDISIIIPFLNEEENIPFLVQELDAFILKNSELTFEVIFVDDGSIDSSVQLLETIKYPSKIIKLSKNYGSHEAFRAGILHATGKACVNIYADLQEPMELIPIFYKKIMDGSNVVWAYREKVENSLSTRAFSKIFAWLIKTFVSQDFPDNGLDFVMFDEKVRAELNRNIEANSSFTLQILSLGFDQSYVPYTKKERNAGQSKWTLAKKIKIIIDSFVSFSYVPIRFVSVLGITFFLLGVTWTCYIVGRELIVGDLDQGWPALISVLMIGFGVTNIALGIVAEYLWRTLDVSRARPVFLVSEIIETGKE